MAYIWQSFLNQTPVSSILVYLVIVAVAIIALQTIQEKTNIKSVPGPDGGHFLWGHELEVSLHAAGVKFEEWFNKYGLVYRIKGAFFHPDILVVADRGAIHYMLTTNSYNYVKTPFMRPLVERSIGRGLMWAEGPLHKRLRKLVDFTFSAAKVKDMAPIVFDVSSKLHARLSQYLEANDGDTITDVCPWTASATLDIIGRVGFGYEFDGGQSLEAKGIRDSWTAFTNAGMSRVAFYAEVFLRAFPFLVSIPVKSMEAQGRFRNVTQKLAHKMIQIQSGEVNSQGDRGKSRDTSFLDLMKSATDQGKLSLDETVDNVCSFVLAGYDTSAQTLGMILYELAKHPICQEKLREELLALGGQPTYENFMNAGELPYLDAVVKEGLRLYPTLAYNGRVAAADDVIPLDAPIVTSTGQVLKELHVREGQIINMPHISINRLEAVWGDGKCFRPERWIDQDGLPPASRLQHGWSNIMTFSEGPRICLGYRLALLECKSILATLIRDFAFHDTHAGIEFKFSGTLQARVIGREEEGPQLPLRITFLN